MVERMGMAELEKKSEREEEEVVVEEDADLER